jgi:phenylalanine-4-hydroxylase
MLKTKEGIKIYGAAIVSSPEETKHCVGKDSIVHDFDIRKILEGGEVVPDGLQKVYYGSASVDEAIEDCSRYFAETF